MIKNFRIRSIKNFLLNNYQLIIIIFLASIILLFKLGRASLVDWDEAIYAQISREILEKGNWIILHWGGELWFQKPPLYMWITAIFFKLFGINEFWARATSAFSGIGLAVVTYLIGKNIYSKLVGFISSLILLSTYHFVFASRFGTTDIMLTFFIYLAFYFYLKINKVNSRFWYGVWASCGLALMIKGMAGLIAPIVIIAMMFLDKKFISYLKSKNFWLGILLASLIVLPWHLIVFYQYGRSFIDQYLSYHVLARATHPIEGHIGDRYFYIDTIKKLFFPWFYLVPFALAYCLKENIIKKSRSLILGVVILLVFGLFTIVKTKLDWYIIPIYPALAILISQMISIAFKNYKTIAYGGLLFGTLLTLLLTSQKLIIIFVLILIISTSILYLLKKNAYKGIALASVIFLLIVAFNNIRPFYNLGFSPVASIAQAASKENTTKESPIIVFSGLVQPTPLFYSQRPILVAGTDKEIKSLVKDDRTNEIIIDEKDIKAISNDYKINTLVKIPPYIYAELKPKN